jgi:hypothetical protein
VEKPLEFTLILCYFEKQGRSQVSQMTGFLGSGDCAQHRAATLPGNGRNMMWLEVVQMALAVIIVVPCAGLMLHQAGKRNRVSP